MPHRPSKHSIPSQSDQAHINSDQIGLERLVFFSDAVFAIAITLLALEIRLPQGDGSVSDAYLLNILLATWQKILAYVISFMVIGTNWIAHHRKFRFVRNYDNTLILLNLLMLMMIAFIPFPSSVISEYSNRTATIFYALTIILSGLFSAAIGWHIVHTERLIVPDLDAKHRRRLYLAPLLTSAVFALSIGIAFYDLGLTRLSWILILPVSYYANRN
jgi:uncharacterized membrane protein